MARTCPLCHQHYAVERLGVRLPPLKAGIFDAIKQAGDVGVTSAEIVAGSLYRERRHASHDTIKAHIWQINELLEETNWIIQSESDYGTSERRWHMRQRRMRKAAA
jgi:hypothetical protein